MLLVAVPMHAPCSVRRRASSREEFMHILSGSLEVNVGSESFELQEGDSITYDAGLPHVVRHGSSQKAVAIAVVTPPSF